MSTASTGIETIVTDQWFKTVLGYEMNVVDTVLADHVTGVYDGLAPAGASYPFVVWDVASPATDVVGIGTPSARIMSDALYQVRVTTKSDEWTADQIAAVRRIDAILNGAQATVTDGLVLGCVRTEQYRFIEQHEGRQIRHLGGIYRVLVQSS